MAYKRLRDIMKNIWVEFIYGGHLIALGAVCIVLTAVYLINIKLDWDYLFIVYLATYFFIFLNRLGEKKIDFLTNPYRTNYIEKNYKIRIVFIIFTGFAFFIFLLLYKNFLTLYAGLLFIIIGITYNNFLKKTTSKIPIFKNICFSLMIIFPIALLFIANYKTTSTTLFFLISIFIFFRMLVNTIFLDIKDVESDKKSALKTLPIIVGYKKTIFFLKILTVISGLLLILGSYLNIIPKYSLALLFVIPYSFYYFKKSEDIKNFYLVNYILADTEFILWPISIIFIKSIL